MPKQRKRGEWKDACERKAERKYGPHNSIVSLPSASAFAEAQHEVIRKALLEISYRHLPPNISVFSVGSGHIWHRVELRKSCLNGLCPRANCTRLHYYLFGQRGLDAYNTCLLSSCVLPRDCTTYNGSSPYTTDQVRMATGFLKGKSLETPKLRSYTRAAR